MNILTMDELESEFYSYYVEAEEYIIPSDKDPETGQRYYLRNTSASEIDIYDAVEELLEEIPKVRSKFRLDSLSESDLDTLKEKLKSNLISDSSSWLRLKDIENDDNLED